MAHGTAHRQTPNSTAHSHTKIISCSRHTAKVGTPLPPRAASPPAPPQLDRERQEQSRAAHNSAYKRREAQRSPVQQAAPRDRALTPRPHSRLALTPRPRASPSPRALTPCPPDSPSRLRPRASAHTAPRSLRQRHYATSLHCANVTAPRSLRQGPRRQLGEAHLELLAVRQPLHLGDARFHLLRAEHHHELGACGGAGVEVRVSASS